MCGEFSRSRVYKAFGKDTWFMRKGAQAGQDTRILTALS